ncbi:MAG TPA: ATP/GTP-binding protein [Methanoregula sp.]|nr:ATP/GTP-binding protein [Methanoregula sp.]
MVEEKYKIVVFGAFGAGKSTFIQTLDPQAKHIEADCPEKGTTTIALDYGRVQIGEKRIYLYGTPGQERFEFARDIIGRGMDGAILLVDTTVPVDEFIDHLYRSIDAAKIPFVVLLNKCDAAGAQPDTAKAHFSVAETIAVSAKDQREAREALEGFIGTLRPHNSGNKTAA